MVLSVVMVLVPFVVLLAAIGLAWQRWGVPAERGERRPPSHLRGSGKAGGRDGWT